MIAGQNFLQTLLDNQKMMLKCVQRKKIRFPPQVDEQREDFANIPPAQRKAKLQKKIDEIRSKIAHETAER